MITRARNDVRWAATAVPDVWPRSVRAGVRRWFPRICLCLRVGALLIVGVFDSHLPAQGPGGFRLLGAASCASSACHGAVAGIAEEWRSSVSVWEADDPHARAGQILTSDQSSAMIVALDARAAEDEDVFVRVIQDRCEACHLTSPLTQHSIRDLPGNAAILEGVSCESCHGEAANWIESHTRTEWQGPARFETATGMLDTETWMTRVEVCARCHVGSRSPTSRPRDMNHDLIAAGHPALRFDPLAYMEALPAHWSRSAEQQQHDGRSATQMHLSGRWVALAAVAGLAIDRESSRSSGVSSTTVSPGPNSRGAAAGRAPVSQMPGDVPAASISPPEHQADGLGQDDVPQPEFADYDCFACHQRLTGATRPVDRGAMSAYPAWNSWYTAGLANAVRHRAELRCMPRRGTSQQQQYLEMLHRIRQAAEERAQEVWRQTPAAPADELQRLIESRDRIHDWHDAIAAWRQLQVSLRSFPTSSGAEETAHESTGQRSAHALLDRFRDSSLAFGGQDDERFGSPVNFRLEEFHQLLEALQQTLNTGPTP